MSRCSCVRCVCVSVWLCVRLPVPMCAPAEPLLTSGTATPRTLSVRYVDLCCVGYHFTGGHRCNGIDDSAGSDGICGLPSALTPATAATIPLSRSDRCFPSRAWTTALSEWLLRCVSRWQRWMKAMAIAWRSVQIPGMEFRAKVGRCSS